jgi:hypothetical protein
VLYSSHDHLTTGMCDLDHPILADAENTDSWHTGKGDLQRAFPLNIPMVPSYALTVISDSERLTCSGFSLDETIRLGSFEFIADYFGGLSLSPRRGNSGAAFMGSMRSGTPSPRWAMIGDSAEEFLTVSSGEGAPSSHFPGGVARGLHPLSSQPHHGWRMLRPPRP